MIPNAKHITVTDEDFKYQVLESPEPVLVDFWAEWCGPCHVIAPVIEGLAADFKGQAKVAKVDVDKNPDIASQYHIHSIPTLLFFKDGEVVDRVIGVVSKKVLQEKLNALVHKGQLQSTR